MALILLVAASISLGAGIHRWWTLVLPVSLGCLAAVAVSASGHGLRDTPIAFLVATTVAMAVGVLLRRSLVWRGF